MESHGKFLASIWSYFWVCHALTQNSKMLISNSVWLLWWISHFALLLSVKIYLISLFIFTTPFSFFHSPFFLLFNFSLISLSHYLFPLPSFTPFPRIFLYFHLLSSHPSFSSCTLSFLSILLSFLSRSLFVPLFYFTLFISLPSCYCSFFPFIFSFIQSLRFLFSFSSLHSSPLSPLHTLSFLPSFTPFTLSFLLPPSLSSSTFFYSLPFLLSPSLDSLYSIILFLSIPSFSPFSFSFFFSLLHLLSNSFLNNFFIIFKLILINLPFYVIYLQHLW